MIEIEKLRDKNLEALLSGYKISEFVLQNIKKDKIPKKFGMNTHLICQSLFIRIF